MHRFLLHNGEIRNTSEALISPGQTGYLTGWGVFSTLRVVEGVLFAFERHYRRMKHDAARLRVPFEYSEDQLHALLLQLVEANRATNATLRVSLLRNRGGAFEGQGIRQSTDLVVFTSDLREWGSGVKLAYIPNGRFSASPFAGAKITSWAENLTWYEDAQARGYDEVILLNEHGQVSECTSANIFAIRGNEVLTPPAATSGCLPGVTRAILLEEVNVTGLRLAEAELSPSELESSRQVFITSTTRDLLPVLEIEGFALQQDPTTLNSLRAGFARFREIYTEQRRHAMLSSAPV